MPSIGGAENAACFAYPRNFMTGFGLLFMDLSLLKKSVPDIKSNPEALEWISSLGSEVLAAMGLRD